jgi:hypothetical protein
MYFTKETPMRELKFPEPGLMSDVSKGTTEGYRGRGVFVPYGLDVELIMECAAVLEKEFEIAPYTSREITIAVLQSVSAVLHRRTPENL